MLVHYAIDHDAFEKVRYGVPASFTVAIPGVTSEKEINVDLSDPRYLNDPGINRALDKFEKDATIFTPYTYMIWAYDDEISNCITHPSIIDIYMLPTPGDVKERLIAEDVLPTGIVMAINDETCTCCELTESIYSTLQQFQSEHAINCPVCGKAIDIAMLSPITVQEANYYSFDQHVGIYPVMECQHCGSDIALIPTKIIYNANHDVYYTGGADYMATEFNLDTAADEIDKIFEKDLWPHILDFVKRKLNPEDWQDKSLTFDNLKLWTSRDFKAALCKYFYNNGLKE